LIGFSDQYFRRESRNHSAPEPQPNQKLNMTTEIKEKRTSTPRRTQPNIRPFRRGYCSDSNFEFAFGFVRMQNANQ
jgi:hypothetical protein